MPDTNRTLAALQALLADNTTADISPADLRDAIYSLFRLANKGDLLGIDAAGLLGALPPTTDGFVLTLDAASTYGFKWVSAGAASVTYATTAELADVAAVESAGGADTTVPRGAHVHAHGSGYLPNAHHNQSHGNADHTSTFVTQTEIDTSITTHAGLADPHTGYRLESADHTHASTGIQGGIVAAGVISNTPAGTVAATTVQAAIDELATDYAAADSAHAGAADPHTGYVLESLLDAKGDLITASADNTPAKLTVGADDTILMADSAAAGGLKWVASASPSAIGTAAATGTADTFTRGDHVHAHEPGHVAHDTIWDAAGDLAIGTGADTAARLAITVPAANIRNVLGVDNGETTWSVKPMHDGTAPAAVGTAAAGTALTAAHRDHVHATGAGTPSTQAFGDAAATGAGPAAAMTDHKHAMPANPVTSPSSAKMAIYIPAEAFKAALTNGPAWSLTEAATNKETYGAWGFNDTTEQTANAKVFMPGWYDAGTMTAYVEWTSASGANGVTWGISLVQLPDNTAIDTAYGTEVTIDDTVLTSNYVHITPVSGAITPGGTPGTRRPMWVKVARKVGNANDTKVGDAQLLGVYLLYGVTTLVNS